MIEIVIALASIGIGIAIGLGLAHSVPVAEYRGWRTYALRLEDAIADVADAWEDDDREQLCQAVQRADAVLQAGIEGV